MRARPAIAPHRHSHTATAAGSAPTPSATRCSRVTPVLHPFLPPLPHPALHPSRLRERRGLALRCHHTVNHHRHRRQQSRLMSCAPHAAAPGANAPRGGPSTPPATGACAAAAGGTGCSDDRPGRSHGCGVGADAGVWICARLSSSCSCLLPSPALAWGWVCDALHPFLPPLPHPGSHHPGRVVPPGASGVCVHPAGPCCSRSCVHPFSQSQAPAGAHSTRHTQVWVCASHHAPIAATPPSPPPPAPCVTPAGASR
jgi:hypothetical protein